MDRLLPPTGDSLQGLSPPQSGEAAHENDSGQPAQTFASIGIDIGKEVFHIVGFERDGKIAFRARSSDWRWQRPSPSCRRASWRHGGMPERPLRQPGAAQLGHKPRIIPAIYVKPFVKGQKNDYNDAEAIAEAALRPNLRVVREKTQDQLDLQALHRVRSRLVSRRTATINQIRAFLIEQGIAVRTGAPALCATRSWPFWRTGQDEISPRMSGLIVGLYEDWMWLDERIETLAGEIEQISREGSQLPAPHERSRHRSADLDRRGRRHWYRRGIRARA